MPIAVTCITCGTVKSFPPCIAKNRKYCSLACVPKKGKNNPNWKGGLAERECAQCQKVFFVKQKEVRKGWGKYCSRQCQFAAMLGQERPHSRRRVEKECLSCGGKISVKKSRAEIQGAYCSIACMAKGYSERMRGESNPNYRHGNASVQSYYASIRRGAEGKYSKNDIEKMRTLQKNKCASCSVSFKKTGFHIDHIVPIARGGTNWPDNLQLLCPSCNCRKNAKDPIEWANENGKLL